MNSSSRELILALREKLDSLELLFNPKYFLTSLFECIIVSFLVLIITYFLLSLSRVILNFHEKIITPWVYQVTDKSSIVLKKDFERLNLDREGVQKRFEQERETRIRLEKEIEELENKIKKSLISDSSTQNESNPAKNENDKLIELLENKGYLELFESLIFIVNNDEWALEEGHKFFITLGLLTSIEKQNSYRRYEFTERGKNLQDYYRVNFLFADSELDNKMNKVATDFKPSTSRVSVLRQQEISKLKSSTSKEVYQETHHMRVLAKLPATWQTRYKENVLTTLKNVLIKLLSVKPTD